ncbi:MAG: glutamine synthetase [Clostridiales bacterium]|nr:glutamine synthetase [Clostridiales bacterium]
MDCSIDEFMQYIEEEDIKFIRLLFCDIFGTPKNISVMPGDIRRALTSGIGINPMGIQGFPQEACSDIFLHPEPHTAALLPWRPDQGRVVRLFCDIKYQDGSEFGADTRNILKKAVAEAAKEGIKFTFGTRIEFYLFKTDDEGEPTKIPHDKAGYMDIAPLDKGENVRREICLTLERMGITPVNSHHEAGPGQNEIDFVSADPLKAADDTVTFISVVKTIAARNGLNADFSPKPLAGQPGNGFHVNVSAERDGDRSVLPSAIAGILDKIYDFTIFLNRCEDSYQRIGKGNAPRFISWSNGNYGQLIRVPQTSGHHYAQLRSPDAFSNPYLMFALLIHSGLYGIRNNMELMNAANFDLKSANPEILAGYRHLPRTIDEAKEAAGSSEFIKSCLPKSIIDTYCS